MGKMIASLLFYVGHSFHVGTIAVKICSVTLMRILIDILQRSNPVLHSLHIMMDICFTLDIRAYVADLLLYQNPAVGANYCRLPA